MSSITRRELIRRYIRLAAVVAGATFGLTQPALGAAPPLLSHDHGRPPIASAYGGGAFGRWSVDRFGLPSYLYTVDELTNPIAKQPEISGSVDAWSQLGNDRVVADAFNHGYVQLWSQDRLYQWTNYYDASSDHFSGGFGYLNVGGRVISTLYDDRPAGALTQRRFGVGYYEKHTVVRGISERDVVYAPFGNDPILLHDVTIKNTSHKRLRASYFEYWDVNPQIQGVTQIPRGYNAPSWDSSTKTLSVAQLPADADTDPLTIFATALSGRVTAFDADTSGVLRIRLTKNARRGRGRPPHERDRATRSCGLNRPGDVRIPDADLTQAGQEHHAPLRIRLFASE